MNQAYAQWKFRRQNRKFQQDQIFKINLKRMEKAASDLHVMCEFKLFLKPRQIDILGTFGDSYLAAYTESEFKTCPVRRGQSTFETHGQVVSLKGFWGEFKKFFSELDRKGQLEGSEVYVLCKKSATLEALWWVNLNPSNPDRNNDGNCVPQDEFQAQEGKADEGRVGGDGRVQEDAGEMGRNAEVC